MNAVCVIVAGLVEAVLPTRSFTLAWQHSVEKTRWEERYEIRGDRLALTQASIEANGAGMEAGRGARFADGRWTWQPDRAPMPELALAVSPYAGDYQVCWNGRCAALAALVRLGDEPAVVHVRACGRRDGR